MCFIENALSKLLHSQKLAWKA